MVDQYIETEMSRAVKMRRVRRRTREGMVRSGRAHEIPGLVMGIMLLENYQLTHVAAQAREGSNFALAQ